MMEECAWYMQCTQNAHVLAPCLQLRRRRGVRGHKKTRHFSVVSLVF
ncbi:unnamed protein product, partial [Ectocarpus sp. 6 AP-2014]